MRTYVIKGTNYSLQYTGEVTVVGVTSSRKLAIKACADWIEEQGNNPLDKNPEKFQWVEQNKHDGHASKPNLTVSYKMFYVNRIDD